MLLPKKQFERLKLLNNYVLVKPDPGNDKVTLKNGMVLFLATSHNKEQHAVTCGTVVKLPKSLTYFEDNGLYNLDFFTTQELKIGDRVIFHYMQTMVNITQDRMIEVDGEVYFLVYYDKIFCAMRGEEVIPVNGIVIVEADKGESVLSGGLIIPEQFRKKSETTGTIRYIGTPLGGYNDFQHLGPDADEHKVGDKILFRSVDSVPLQFELHQSLDKGKTLYRMRRKDILGNYDRIKAVIDNYESLQSYAEKHFGTRIHNINV